MSTKRVEYKGHPFTVTVRIGVSATPRMLYGNGTDSSRVMIENHLTVSAVDNPGVTHESRFNDATLFDKDAFKRLETSLLEIAHTHLLATGAMTRIDQLKELGFN